MKKALCLIAALGYLCGCSIINPYQSEFSCPDTFKGKCASVREVYMEDAAGGQKDRADSAAVKPRCTTTSSGMENGDLVTTCSDPLPADADNIAAGTSPLASSFTGNTEDTNYNRYRSALYDKFNGLLKEPQTPIVAPPKVMRVLLLPYTGQENEFYMLRYVYFFVDKPRWILGDSVTANGEDE
ncbi:MAG: type IV conjugative transfer system lipoprotein TraV [Geobacter sp.]|nr:type IV conjugative transfer system lipoprotein TraV [Geobacter sp.]